MTRIVCQNCGAAVDVPLWRTPVTYVARPADALGPAQYLIVSHGDWLIHHCPLHQSNSRSTATPWRS